MNNAPLIAIASEIAKATVDVEEKVSALQACFDRLSSEQRESDEGEAIHVIIDRLSDAAGLLRISEVELIDLAT